MRAFPVDPRDQVSEVDDPFYRVFIWDDRGGACDEWELGEADLDEVLAWVALNGGGRRHSLWVGVRTGPGVHLTRLRGIDPPAPASTWPPWATDVRTPPAAQ